MLFLWKSNSIGKIWIDGDGFKELVSSRLPDGCVCQEVSFVADGNVVHIFISYPEGYDDAKRSAFGKRIGAIFQPAGIKPQIHWSVRRQGDIEPGPISFMRYPVFWGGLGALAVALFHLGIKGVGWSLLFGCLCFGVSWFILTEDGKRIAKSIIREFRR